MGRMDIRAWERRERERVVTQGIDSEDLSLSLQVPEQSRHVVNVTDPGLTSIRICRWSRARCPSLNLSLKGTKRLVRRVPTGLNRVSFVLYHGLFAITCIALSYKGKGSREAFQLLMFNE